MPKLREWFHHLSARLRHVRILNGDWNRACTRGALVTLSCKRPEDVGVLLDPPYSGAVRQADLYSVDSFTVAADVLRWCCEHTDRGWRIVLAGFAGEGHEALLARGWREYEWYVQGYLTGGMGKQGKQGGQQHRERLWASPACSRPATEDGAGQGQLSL
jgi:hypothetical protein